MFICLYIHTVACVLWLELRVRVRTQTCRQPSLFTVDSCIRVTWAGFRATGSIVPSPYSAACAAVDILMKPPPSPLHTLALSLFLFLLKYIRYIILCEFQVYSRSSHNVVLFMSFLITLMRCHKNLTISISLW